MSECWRRGEGWMEDGGKQEVGSVSPLVICRLTNYKLGLSSSEARRGYNHPIHQPTCLSMALTHYTSGSAGHRPENRASQI